MSRNTCVVDVPGISSVIGISYSYYHDPMANVRWKDDVAYAMNPFKLLTWPIGVWPLQVYNVYSLVRSTVASCCVVRIIFNVSGPCRVTVWTYVKHLPHHVAPNKTSQWQYQVLELLDNRRPIIGNVNSETFPSRDK